MKKFFHYGKTKPVLLKDACDYFRILFFFLQKKKCSRVTSNCHIGMRVGAFESSDDEETFSFLFHGHKRYRKFSRDTQT